MNEWYRIEFWSQQSQAWVALFDREDSSAGAEKKAREWLLEAKSRVVKVTQQTEVVWESRVICEACRNKNCLACDGGDCRCVCALTMDVAHRANQQRKDYGETNANTDH